MPSDEISNDAKYQAFLEEQRKKYPNFSWVITTRHWTVYTSPDTASFIPNGSLLVVSTLPEDEMRSLMLIGFPDGNNGITQSTYAINGIRLPQRVTIPHLHDFVFHVSVHTMNECVRVVEDEEASTIKEQLDW